MNQVLIIFKWFLVISILLFFVIFTNYSHANEDISLNKIQIKKSVDNFINQKILMLYLEEKSFCFDSVLAINFNKEKLEEVLASHYAIKEVEVFTNQKGDIGVIIEQKKPIVRIKNKSDDYFLDEFGDKMQLSDNYTPNLVVATGEITSEDHFDIYSFIMKINESEFWNAQIAQIHFEKDMILLIPRVGNHKINLGSFYNVSTKLDNLYQFYKSVMPVKGWQAYSEINLSFNNQIVCVRKKK
tara:strand:- start:926 stop:1651 length:726 start_codon:yes stop_codon:yes gene_type:complete